MQNLVAKQIFICETIDNEILIFRRSDMEYNPSQYIVKAFSRRQSLWVGIGTVLGEAIPHHIHAPLNIRLLFLQNFPGNRLWKFFCF